MNYINKRRNLNQFSCLFLIFTLAVVNIVSANTNALDIQNKTTTSEFNFDSIYTPISSNKFTSTATSRYQAFTIPTSNSATFKYMVWRFYSNNNCTTLLQSVQIGQESQPATLGPNTYTALDAANFKICSRYGSTGCAGEYTNAKSVQVTYVYNSGSSIIGQCYNNNSNVSGDKLSVNGGSGACTSIASCLFTGSYNPDALTLWTNVGSSATMGTDVSLAIDKSGVPYVAYFGTSSQTLVMKFNGTSWVSVGGAASTGPASDNTLVINESGIPYLAYSDYATGVDGKATVMRFNGSNWVSVGSRGFSAGRASQPSLAIDSSGTPYLAYESGTHGPAVVVKFNGTAWVNVGSPGFSAAIADDPSLALDEMGNPYLAYESSDDFSNFWPVVVMKFNSGTWVNVGTGFGTRTSDINIAINNGTPYVSYLDYADNYKASVKKFDGTNWVFVGSPGFSAVATSPSFAISESGIPYFAYESGNPGPATVMKFNGTAWVNVGSPGFSGVGANYASLAINESGTPYVAFSESNSNNVTTVKFNGN